MKVKIIGFKVGVTRPTYNRTIELDEEAFWEPMRPDALDLAKVVYKALVKSDFLSIRKV